MGILSAELAPHVSPRPRVYADANVPAGLVAHMRARLHWDVLFVLEEDELRRAPDLEHYRLAQRLRRTLITLDRDYLDDRRFPPEEGSGVLVINAPNERELLHLIVRVDRALFRAEANVTSDLGGPRAAPNGLQTSALPLAGRKLQINTEWGRDT